MIPHVRYMYFARRVILLGALTGSAQAQTDILYPKIQNPRGRYCVNIKKDVENFSKLMANSKGSADPAWVNAIDNEANHIARVCNDSYSLECFRRFEDAAKIQDVLPRELSDRCKAFASAESLIQITDAAQLQKYRAAKKTASEKSRANADSITLTSKNFRFKGLSLGVTLSQVKEGFPTKGVDLWTCKQKPEFSVLARFCYLNVKGDHPLKTIGGNTVDSYNMDFFGEEAMELRVYFYSQKEQTHQTLVDGIRDQYGKPSETAQERIDIRTKDGKDFEVFESLIYQDKDTILKVRRGNFQRAAITLTSPSIKEKWREYESKSKLDHAQRNEIDKSIAIDKLKRDF